MYPVGDLRSGNPKVACDPPRLVKPTEEPKVTRSSEPGVTRSLGLSCPGISPGSMTIVVAVKGAGTPQS